jgi:hypothetical protein
MHGAADQGIRRGPPPRGVRETAGGQLERTSVDDSRVPLANERMRHGEQAGMRGIAQARGDGVGMRTEARPRPT